MDEPGPRVSVVICAYTLERLKDIHEAVNSMLVQTLPPHEVIVSVDHNRELLQRLQVEMPAGVALVFNDGAPGLSETRNAAIRVAKGDIIAFMDDDAVAEKDWLQKLAQPFDEPAVVAVGGRIVPLWLDGGRPKWFPEELDWIVGCTYKGLPHQGNRVRNPPGCNMAFRREVFQRVGLFSSDIGGLNETRRGGEEAELCLRLVREIPGALIVYEPGALIHHKVHSRKLSFRYIAQSSYNEGRYKKMVRERSSDHSQNPLSTESSYLRYLVATGILRRSREIHRPGELLRAGAILLVIAAVAVGYLGSKPARAFTVRKLWDGCAIPSGRGQE